MTNNRKMQAIRRTVYIGPAARRPGSRYVFLSISLGLLTSSTGGAARANNLPQITASVPSSPIHNAQVALPPTPFGSLSSVHSATLNKSPGSASQINLWIGKDHASSITLSNTFKQALSSISTGTVSQGTLSLGSTQLVDQASQLAGFHTLTIDVGGKDEVVNLRTKLTQAEALAADQVLVTGKQSLVLNTQGAATGGSLTLNSKTLAAIDELVTGPFSSLIIPKQVEVVDTLSNFSLSGDITNSGKIVAAATGQDLIAAQDINNSTGASITAAQSAVLTIQAQNNINNQGAISSQNSLTLNSTALANSGSIKAPGVIEIGASTVQNSGLIQSSQSNINFASPSTITVNNASGTLQATNGNINFRTADFAGTGNITINGGNLLSQNLNLDAGQGAVNIDAGLITGAVNGQAASAQISGSTPDLLLGGLQTTGDPTYFNQGNITITSSFAPTGGQPLAIVAKGNILSDGGVLDTSSLNGNGGALTLIAGATFTTSTNATSSNGAPDSSTTITITQIHGGSIDLAGGASGTAPITAINTSSSSNGAGGNVLFLANGSYPAISGSITIPSSLTIMTGSSVGSGGSVTMATEATAGNGISIGSINTTGTSQIGGSITLEGALSRPNNLTILNGAITGGSITYQTELLATISAKNLSAAGAPVTIDTSATVSIGSINTAGAGISSGQNGGAVSIEAGGDQVTKPIVVTVGNIYTFGGGGQGGTASGSAGVNGGTGGNVTITAFEGGISLASINASGGGGGGGAAGNGAGGAGGLAGNITIGQVSGAYNQSGILESVNGAAGGAGGTLSGGGGGGSYGGGGGGGLALAGGIGGNAGGGYVPGTSGTVGSAGSGGGFIATMPTVASSTQGKGGAAVGDGVAGTTIYTGNFAGGSLSFQNSSASTILGSPTAPVFTLVGNLTYFGYGSAYFAQAAPITINSSYSRGTFELVANGTITFNQTDTLYGGILAPSIYLATTPGSNGDINLNNTSLQAYAGDVYLIAGGSGNIIAPIGQINSPTNLISATSGIYLESGSGNITATNLSSPYAYFDAPGANTTVAIQETLTTGSSIYSSVAGNNSNVQISGLGNLNLALPTASAPPAQTGMVSASAVKTDTNSNSNLTSFDIADLAAQVTAQLKVYNTLPPGPDKLKAREEITDTLQQLINAGYSIPNSDIPGSPNALSGRSDVTSAQVTSTATAPVGQITLYGGSGVSINPGTVISAQDLTIGTGPGNQPTAVTIGTAKAPVVINLIPAAGGTANLSITSGGAAYIESTGTAPLAITGAGTSLALTAASTILTIGNLNFTSSLSVIDSNTHGAVSIADKNDPTYGGSITSPVVYIGAPGGIANATSTPDAIVSGNTTLQSSTNIGASGASINVIGTGSNPILTITGGTATSASVSASGSGVLDIEKSSGESLSVTGGSGLSFQIVGSLNAPNIDLYSQELIDIGPSQIGTTAPAAIAVGNGLGVVSLTAGSNSIFNTVSTVENIIGGKTITISTPGSGSEQVSIDLKASNFSINSLAASGSADIQSKATTALIISSSNVSNTTLQLTALGPVSIGTTTTPATIEANNLQITTPGTITLTGAVTAPIINIQTAQLTLNGNLYTNAQNNPTGSITVVNPVGSLTIGGTNNLGEAQSLNFSAMKSLTLGTIANGALNDANSITLQATLGSITAPFNSLTAQPDPSGNGGTINITAANLVDSTSDKSFPSAAYTFSASGSGSGNGGNIDIALSGKTNNAILGTDLILNAVSGTTGGNGGNVAVAVGGNLTVPSGTINNGLGTPTNNGNGGSLSLAAGGNLLIEQQINTSGSGGGTAGDVTLSSGSKTPFSIGSASTANGVQGSVSGQNVQIAAPSISISSPTGSVSASNNLTLIGASIDNAGSLQAGSDGTLSISNPTGALTIAPGGTWIAPHAVDISAKGAIQLGNLFTTNTPLTTSSIAITSTGGAIDFASGIEGLTALAPGDGAGGSITVLAASLVYDKAAAFLLTADGGNNSSGTVTIALTSGLVIGSNPGQVTIDASRINTSATGPVISVTAGGKLIVDASAIKTNDSALNAGGAQILLAAGASATGNLQVTNLQSLIAQQLNNDIGLSLTSKSSTAFQFGNATATGNGVMDTVINLSGSQTTLSITNLGGSISPFNVGSTGSLQPNAITLQTGGTGSIGSATSAITVSVPNLNETTASGSAYINDTASGQINLTASSGGNLSLTAALGTVAASSPIKASSLSLNVAAIANPLTTTATSITLTTNNASATINDTATTPITIGQTNLGSGSLTVNAAGSIITGAKTSIDPLIVAADIYLQAAGTGSILIGTGGVGAAGDDVYLSTASGSIADSSAQSGYIQGITVQATSTSGSIGGTTGLKTEASQTLNSGTTGSVYLINLSSSDVAAGITSGQVGSYELVANAPAIGTGTLTLGAVATTNGSIAVSSNTGTLIALSGGTALGGNIEILATDNSAQINLGGNFYASSTAAKLGDVEIALGAFPKTPVGLAAVPYDGTYSGFLSIYSYGGGSAYLGQSGLLSGPNSAYLYLEGRNIIFNTTNTSPSGNISFTQNTSITADPPSSANAALNSLAPISVLNALPTNTSSNTSSVTDSQARLSIAQNASPDTTGGASASSASITFNTVDSSGQSGGVFGGTIQLIAIQQNTIQQNTIQQNTISASSLTNSIAPLASSLTGQSALLTSTSNLCNIAADESAGLSSNGISAVQKPAVESEAKNVNRPLQGSVEKFRNNAKQGNSQLNESASIDKKTLTTGALLLMPTKKTVVETPFGSVGAAKGAVVLLIATCDKLTIYDLHDPHAGSVTFEHGVNRTTFAPGRGATFYTGIVNGFEQANPVASVGYRHISNKKVADDLSAYHCEFHIMSLVSSLKPLKEVFASRDPLVHGFAKNLLKTVALLSVIQSDNSEFRLYSAPQITAMNR